MATGKNPSILIYLEREQTAAPKTSPPADRKTSSFSTSSHKFVFLDGEEEEEGEGNTICIFRYLFPLFLFLRWGQIANVCLTARPEKKREEPPPFVAFSTSIIHGGGVLGVIEGKKKRLLEKQLHIL